MGFLIAALVVGALASAGAGILGRANEREEATKEANYQIAQNNLDIQALEQNKTQALGQMEKELAVSKENDLAQAAATQRGATNQFTTSMQETYLSQLAGKSKHMDLVANTTQERGQLNSAMGSSGARADTTLATVMGADQRRQIAESQAALASSQELAVGAGQMSLAEANTQARELRDKYNEGSAFMELYNLKRQEIEDASAIDLQKLTAKDSYLDSIVEDNKYDLGWFMADFFGVAGAAAGAATSLYGLGAFGGSGASGGSKGFSSTYGLGYNTWSGTASNRSR